MVEFEWDAGKAASKLSKHGIDFAEAMTVFSDALEVMVPDPAHSAAELRFVSTGLSKAGRILTVAYTEATGAFESSARGKLLPESGDSMSQEISPEEDEDMLPEYDFAHGVRGKHYEDYRAGTNVVFLEPDLAKVFKDSDSVNRVLRLLLSLAKESAVTNKPA